jgi:hypothetical protein
VIAERSLGTGGVTGDERGDRAAELLTTGVRIPAELPFVGTTKPL